MPHSLRAVCVAALFLAATGCGGSATPPSPTAPSPATQTLHGEVTDPIGDALSDSRVPVSPDLVHATADVADGSITFVIQFAPGTVDRQTTMVTVNLDTDQNASTGIQQGGGVGADYGIALAASTARATVNKADPVGCAARLSCFNAVGSVPMTVVGDEMRATVPLSLLGNDDGRMSFRVHSYVSVDGSPSSTLDFEPNDNLPPGRIP